MKQGLFHIFKRIFFSTMGRNVLFLGPDKIVFYRYNRGSGAFQTANGKKGTSNAGFPKNALLVVGREFYFETNHTFPITTFRDLAKAVSLDAPSLAPQDYCRFAFFPHKEVKQSLVNLWFFKPELKDWVDRVNPIILLPESVLLGNPESGNRFVYYGKRRGRLFFCFRKRRGELLSRLVSDDVATDQALADFKRLAGRESIDAQAISLGSSRVPADSEGDDSDYYFELVEKLQGFPPGIWRRFLCRERFRPAQISRPFFCSLAAVLIIFFVLPISFSYWHSASVNRDLLLREKLITQKAKLYLNMKEDVEKKTALLKKLQAPLAAYVPRTVMLSEIGQLIKPSQDTLTSFRLVGETLEIRGNTTSSSDLMARLGKSGFFSDVRLSSPVIKDRKSGKERFVIEITVRKPGIELAKSRKPRVTTGDE